jgi:hypothetical protein
VITSVSDSDRDFATRKAKVVPEKGKKNFEHPFKSSLEKIQTPPLIYSHLKGTDQRDGSG